ncbi:hypothetical protein [Synechococcus sp. CBW1107]|uniref:hypothetical protein n=1 Tax=Synechococcus sp. CBW1107 TaxID=2789857 RepID=UPI003A0FBD15
MIVVAIVGILSAVALPQFLNARTAAATGSKIGEALGIAKECATAAASKIAVGTTTPGAGITVTPVSDCMGGGSIVATFDAGAAGIKCLTDTSTSTSTTATITVGSTGTLSCAFGGGG